MQQIDITVETSSAAAPGDVFRLLRDGSTWPQWSFFEKFELAKTGWASAQSASFPRAFRAPAKRWSRSSPAAG
jgi:hypothetical protein